MQLPLDKIVEKIKSNSSLSQEEIENKINEKTRQLSGLISKEGAAQIIANELGIKLFQTEGEVKIKDIVAGMRSVETVGKVVRKFNVNTFKTSDGNEGKVGSILLADETGRIRVTFWHDMADKISSFNEGDILKIKEGYARPNNNRVEIHMNQKAKFFINPEGVTLDNVKETPGERKSIKDLKEGDNDAEILGTVVQVFEPRFFEVCPDCGKRAKLVENSYKCNQHGEVNPDYSYVLNFQIDDGTGNMRVVCFRNQVKALLKKEHNEMLGYRDDPSKFSEVKQDLLGSFVKLVGRVNKNDMFDRLEFVAQLVFRDPDPEKEM